MSRDVLPYDVVIVGAGPSGLAAAIRLKQWATAFNRELSVAVVEKGAEVGAHILAGAVIETQVLDALLPDWRNADGAPTMTAVDEDRFYWLSETRAHALPLPPMLNNHGNVIVSLGNLCRFLAQQAEALGADVFPGFAASEVLYDEHGAVKGIATRDMGVGRDGTPLANFTPGVELVAKQTLFAEGCRGSLTQQLFERFALRRGVDPQTYGIGIKELWEVDPSVHRPGFVQHSVGWPLTTDVYGGSFLYHFDNRQVAVGFVVGLDYSNPWLSPYEEFQRFKTHPAIREVFRGAKRLAYGARAISEGGWQSMPRLTFPGGLLLGDAAGMLNVPKIKGTHLALRSGVLAAEAVAELLTATEGSGLEANNYQTRLKGDWLGKELFAVRNIRPSFHWGLWAGMAYSAVDTYLLRGRAPWTLKQRADHDTLKPADQCPRIDYPSPDGTLTFDRLSSVFLSNTNHEENQPCHLQLKDETTPIRINLALYQAPEQRYCPGGVYEIVGEAGSERLQINAQNCLHCKTCDIKDPTQNIVWVPPEGGGGPNYPNM